MIAAPFALLEQIAPSSLRNVGLGYGDDIVKLERFGKTRTIDRRPRDRLVRTWWR